MEKISFPLSIAIAGSSFYSLHTKTSDFSLSIRQQRKLFSGWTQYKGNKVDVKNYLNLDDKTKKFLNLVKIRYKIQLFLNVKAYYLHVKTSETGKVSKCHKFGNVIFNTNNRFHTNFKADRIDFTFFCNSAEKERFSFQGD